MASIIIHILQWFHIHYGMYVVAWRLGILLFFFSYHIKETKGRQFKWKNYSNKKQSFLANLEYEVWEKPLRKTKGEF